jgi:hypothetical protein
MRTRWLSAAVVAAALIWPATALGIWGGNYYESNWLGSNQSQSSPYEPSLDWNEISFGEPRGVQTVGLTYCGNANSSSCYLYNWTDVAGQFVDIRTISYGRAVCHGAGSNSDYVWVHWCYATNGY